MREQTEIQETAGKARLAAKIVAAYVSKHVVPQAEMSALIKETLDALGMEVTEQDSFVAAKIEKQKPAISIRKSLHNDHITCLECGHNFKSMKRHLLVFHNLSPDDYRAKWRLPADYPMVAPVYAEARSILAKEMGLGRSRKRTRGGKRG